MTCIVSFYSLLSLYHICVSTPHPSIYTSKRTFNPYHEFTFLSIIITLISIIVTFSSNQLYLSVLIFSHLIQIFIYGLIESFNSLILVISLYELFIVSMIMTGS